MESKAPARADFITAIVLIALGIAIIYGSWTMPRLEARGVHPSTVPGLVPGILGIVLTVCGFLLGANAWRAGGNRRVRGEVREAMRRPEAWRLGTAATICLVYALALVGTLPFWLATAIFVFSFVVIFEVPLGETRANLGRTLIFALVLAATTAAVVSYSFQELFLVRLP